jgi:lipoic acid synthetase
MLGLGETDHEVEQTIRDMRSAGVQILTIGQYLPPSRSHWPLQRYVTPERFAELEQLGREVGFEAVASSPLVRSSYKADALAREVLTTAYPGIAPGAGVGK